MRGRYQHCYRGCEEGTNTVTEDARKVPTLLQRMRGRYQHCYRGCEEGTNTVTEDARKVPTLGCHMITLQKYVAQFVVDYTMQLLFTECEVVITTWLFVQVIQDDKIYYVTPEYTVLVL